MALPVKLNVIESFVELKKMLRKYPSHHYHKIKMLIIIKKTEYYLNKEELAFEVGVNPNSIQKWRKKYRQGGIVELLSDGRIGFKPSIISKEMHDKILERLQNKEEGFASFKELQFWVDTNIKKGINYNSLRHYVKKHFGARIKSFKSTKRRRAFDSLVLNKKVS